MHDLALTTPPLEPRFLQPEGWRWHSFVTPRGRRLRFGTVAPKSRIPDAVVIGLQGLSEFTEKYFELAHDLLAHNLSFWMIDWEGHGRSDRPLKNGHKRHSSGFDDDVDDLHSFLMEYVKHAAVHPDVGRIPLVMLAHSMGGNIGLRYLHDHPDMFACAAFTAPLIGIDALKGLPSALSLTATGLLKLFMGKSYIFGGGNWRPEARDGKTALVLSSDPARSAVHNAWCLSDPALQVGNATFGWLHEANRSCALVGKPAFAKKISTPCLLGLAGQDGLVDNDAIRRFAAALPQAQLIEFPESHHEILMERDGIRNSFLDAFYELLRVNNIKEKLKRF